MCFCDSLNARACVVLVVSTISTRTPIAHCCFGRGGITSTWPGGRHECRGAGLKTMGLIWTTADRGSGIAALVICIIAFSGLCSPHGLVDLDAVNQSYSAQMDYHFLLCIEVLPMSNMYLGGRRLLLIIIVAYAVSSAL